MDYYNACNLINILISQGVCNECYTINQPADANRRREIHHHRPGKTEQYRQGYRFGEGKALAVVRPGTVLEMWQILQACVEADVIVITQAANTGLTGGSTPDGNDYDRDIVIQNTMRLNIIQPINNNEQVVCLPGSTLNQLSCC